MRKIISFFLVMPALLFVVSCGDSDEETIECLETEILLENRCEQDITVRYFELDDGFNLVDEILNIDGCDIAEKERIVPSGSSAEIVVFEGACDMDSENGFDYCAGFVSDETIVVQYGNEEKEYSIDGKDNIVINPSDFN